MKSSTKAADSASFSPLFLTRITAVTIPAIITAAAIATGMTIFGLICEFEISLLPSAFAVVVVEKS